MSELRTTYTFATAGHKDDCSIWLLTNPPKPCDCGAVALRPTITKPRNVHPSAVIGEDPQWWGRHRQFPVDIHDTAIVGPLCQIDAGCERPTKIGRGSWVMGMCHVGHGVQMGWGCEIASGTVIAGEVTIGDFVRVGIGARISPYIKIGNAARIGAGAVVTKDVPEGYVVVGNPARTLRLLNAEEVKWVEERFEVLA